MSNASKISRAEYTKPPDILNVISKRIQRTATSLEEKQDVEEAPLVSQVRESCFGLGNSLYTLHYISTGGGQATEVINQIDFL